MIPKCKEYYNYLKHKSRSPHAEPMTDKEKQDLALWEQIYHYEEIGRLKSLLNDAKQYRKD